jgi:hypothetical protein
VTVRPKEPADLLCPSAQPDWKNAVAIGVVRGTAEAPRVTNLDAPVRVTDALLKLADPVAPTEVFRFAATCINDSCRHYGGGACRLAEKVVSMLAPVTGQLPYCTIRVDCRWFHQEGREACMRCPQVVTDNVYPSADMRRAADPDVAVDDPPSPNG